MKANKLSKEIVIETTIQLILDRQGSQNLTIRDISAALGCSHPNIYNYYQTMQELRWDCLLRVLNIMLESVTQRLTTSPDREERYLDFFAALLDFSLQHIGWYKLIWFDPMEKEIPEHVKPHLAAPSIWLGKFVYELYPELGSLEQASRTIMMIHRYFHGEIATLISLRSPFEEEAVLQKRVLTNCWLLLNNRLQGEKALPIHISDLITEIESKYTRNQI
jgi:AcrR family transcriptional regulator